MPGRAKYSRADKHSIKTKMLCYYLFWLCRVPDKPKVRGLLSCKEIERITGVPASTVNKIGRLTL